MVKKMNAEKENLSQYQNNKAIHEDTFKSIPRLLDLERGNIGNLILKKFPMTNNYKLNFRFYQQSQP